MTTLVDPAITQEIIDAKDKLVTQANRAEQVVDDWEQATPVPDAPSDGKLYGRKDGAWDEVTGGGGGEGDMTKAVYDPSNIEADVYDRTNHTGTQAISTITDLQTQLDNKLETQSPIVTDVSTISTDFIYVRAQNESNSGTNILPRAEYEVTPAYWDNGLFYPEEVTVTAGIMTEAFVTKLGGIEDGAQVNKFDYSDAPSDGNEYVRKNGNWTVKTDVGGATWGGITGTLSDQTDLQTALDSKLEEINLSATRDATSVTINNPTGNNAIIPQASTTNAGVLTASDKVKLTGLEQSDWNATSGGAEILNKPTLGTMSSVDDAPSDGKAYNRKDGAWEEASSGGGGGSTPESLQSLVFTQNMVTLPDGTRISFSTTDFENGNTLLAALISRGVYPVGTVWSDVNLQEIRWMGDAGGATGDTSVYPTGVTSSHIGQTTVIIDKSASTGNFAEMYLVCEWFHRGTYNGFTRSMRKASATSSGSWNNIT